MSLFPVQTNGFTRSKRVYICLFRLLLTSIIVGLYKIIKTEEEPKVGALGSSIMLFIFQWRNQNCQ